MCFNRPCHPLILVFVFLSLCNAIMAQPDTLQRVEPNKHNARAQFNKPYVILISADGFRYDYDEIFHARFLQQMRRKGVSSPYMIPSYPSLTFPNHYTLVTGLYPSHHGLVGNTFMDMNSGLRYDKKAAGDSSWYGGTPLWVQAEKNSMLSACFYWVGSEAAIQGIRPAYWYKYSEAMGMDERIANVVNWLRLPEEKRPHLITFYMPEVDHAGHNTGPVSEDTRRAALFVDSAMRKLSAAVDSLGLPVNYIFVSDHGMTAVKRDSLLSLRAIPSDTSRYTLVGGGTLLGAIVKPGVDINKLYTEFKGSARGYNVYTRFNTPDNWHFSDRDDRFNRIPDIMFEPQWPRYFSDRAVKPGQHGYDPAKVHEMYATFIAWGPAFKEGVSIRPFDNVNIFSLVTHILGLPVVENTDGSVEPFLKGLK